MDDTKVTSHNKDTLTLGTLNIDLIPDINLTNLKVDLRYD